MDWAEYLNECLIHECGQEYSLTDIANAQVDDYRLFDILLQQFIESSNVQIQASFAYYLASKSKLGEDYLNQEYSGLLLQSKASVLRTFNELSDILGLSPEMAKRARMQIHRACFGAFDHLNGMVTEGDTGALGDYGPNSLRLEVFLLGKIGQSTQLPDKFRVRRTLEHELNHASSVQTNIKIGLQLLIGRKGVDVNEGMTNLLSEISLDYPGFQKRMGGTIIQPKGELYYRPQTTAMLRLYEQDRASFATLFRAYHGDISNPNDLESALDAFYTICHR